MLQSMFSKLLWGAAQPEESVGADGAAINHTEREEAGDWLVISCQNSCAPNDNSRVNSECDLESVCSDGSWVITPAPTFQHSAGLTHQEDTHSLEDLLIEHPTMSVYRQNSVNEVESLEREAESEVIDGVNEEQNQNRELVLLQNQQRRQLATHLQIPLASDTKRVLPKAGSGKPKLTRRALKRHNPMTRLGVKHQVQKCGFKAGRRRC